MKKTTNNKEIELLTGAGKFMVRYMDYTILFFLFPFIFDVKFADPKVFIAIATLFVIKAIMPTVHEIMGIKEKDDAPEVIETKPDLAPVKIISAPNNCVAIFKASIDSKHQKTEIVFGKGLSQIKIKKSESSPNSDILVSLSDFRTFRIKKTEIQDLYSALLATDFEFFHTGKWTVEISAASLSVVEQKKIDFDNNK